MNSSSLYLVRYHVWIACNPQPYYLRGILRSMKCATHILAGLAVTVLVAGLLLYKTENAPALPSTVGSFAGVSLTIEYALDAAARELGLGGRAHVPEDYGMLFVFPEDGFHGFWMKDTLVPLDIFWLDAQGQVVSIAADAATSTYPHVFYPAKPARYVLETAAGFARTHRVTPGTPLVLKNFPTVSK